MATKPPSTTEDDTGQHPDSQVVPEGTARSEKGNIKSLSTVDTFLGKDSVEVQSFTTGSVTWDSRECASLTQEGDNGGGRGACSASEQQQGEQESTSADTGVDIIGARLKSGLGTDGEGREGGSSDGKDVQAEAFAFGVSAPSSRWCILDININSTIIVQYYSTLYSYGTACGIYCHSAAWCTGG